MKIRDWIVEKLLRIETRQSPIIEATISAMAETQGVGPEWAPTVYGEYYARSVPVYAAIKLRADTIVRPPLRVYKGTPDKKVEVPPTHPLAQLLTMVNEFWTRGDLLRGTSTYLDIWGSCFWVLKKQTPGSPPTEIWLARPDKMRIIGSRKTYIAGYEFDDGVERIPLLPEEVVWFRHFNPMAEISGFAPVAALRLSADLGIDALRSNRNLFKNGLLFNNVWIKADMKMGDTEVADLEKRLKKKFASPENANKPFVGMGLEAKNLGFAPKDMEHVQSLRWSLEDIARVYRVPKLLLEDLEKATYSNIQEAQNIFWRNTIVPYLKFLEEEINEMLVPQFGDETLFTEFDLSEIEALQENMNEVADRLNGQVERGVLTINEYRAELGRKAVPWGDAWWAPPGVLPVTGDTAPLGGEEEVAQMGILPAPRMIDVSSNGYKLWKPPALNDDTLNRIGEMHIKRLDRHEQRFLEMLRELFANQLRDVLKKLRQARSAADFRQRVIKQIGEPLFTAEQWLEQWVENGRPLMVNALIESAREQIDTFGLGISFDVASPITQEWLDRRAEFWAQTVLEETARLLQPEIAEAALGGESIPEIQTRVEKVFRFNDVVRSERIARTEMLAATNQGAVESYAQSGVVEQKMWLTTLDDRTRKAHVEAHRQRVPLEAPFHVGGELLEHPGDGSPENSINCILPGQAISASGISAVSRGFYVGPALELSTKSGRKLAVTPNHPILTADGWKAAQSLRPSDYILGGNFQQGMIPVNQEINYIPPMIEQVYGALNMVLGAGVVRATGVTDFHGDGRYMDGNVQIVTGNGKLWCTCQTLGLEPIHDHSLCSGDILQGVLSRDGPFQAFSPGAGHAPNGIMGFGSQPPSFVLGSAGHASEHGIATATRLDVVLQKAAANDCAADTIVRGERLLGLTAEISLDKIVDIRQFNFSGHVYDLQSSYGQLYTANGVYVHNCRCAVAPVVRNGARALKPGPKIVKKTVHRDDRGLVTFIEEEHSNG